MAMEKLPMCRICLVENVRMVVFANTNLQAIYEKLTDIALVTEDSRPMLACFICHDKLKNCHELQKQCLEAEERFAQMCKEDFEKKPQINQGQLEFSEYAVTSTQHISVSDVCHTESAVVKEESPDDCEGQDGKQHTGGTTPRPNESSDEGDSEDDLPLMEFKIEIKEEEVSQEKRQTEEMKKLELENVDSSYADVKDTSAHDSESCSENDEPVRETKNEVDDEEESIGAAVVKKQDTRISKLEDTITLIKKKKTSRQLIFGSKIIKKTQNVTSKLVTKFKEPIANSKQGVNNKINITALVTNTCNNSKKDDIRGKTSNKDYNDINGHQKVLWVRKKCIKCDICQLSFRHGSILKRHIRMHTGETPFKCEICERSFRHGFHLKRHIRTHAGEKPFKCDVCQRSFTLKGGLVSHIRVHTGEKPFKCDVCQRSFTEKSSLTNHIRTHTGEKPFKCDICQRSFSANSNLKNHIRTHTGESPFKCDICQRSFKQSSTLRKRIRTHSDETPFNCDICQRSFSANSNLKNHIRTHTDESPFKCDICQRSFKQSSTLRRHIRTHTDESPFKCDICQCSFKQSSSISRHIRRKHC